MLKKLSLLAALCFAAIPLAPSATAWEQVCVNFAAPHDGRINIIYNFNEFAEERSGESVDALLQRHRDNDGPSIRSGWVGMFTAGCVSLADLPEGTPFLVRAAVRVNQKTADGRAYHMRGFSCVADSADDSVAAAATRVQGDPARGALYYELSQAGLFGGHTECRLSHERRD